jgi:hypothetical protein
MRGSEPYTIPKGTQVHPLKEGGFVVSSVKLLKDLSGNTWDPIFRYHFINKEDLQS